MQITNCGGGVHSREIAGIDKLRSLPNNWYAFTNLDLVLGPGRTREIDVVLVADDRIFLIDLKDWGGKIESSDGNWLQNGEDRGPSPVAKVSQNARDLGILLGDDIRRRANSKRAIVPRVIGLVVITGRADFSNIAPTEVGSVSKIDDFLRSVVSIPTRISRFGAVSPAIVANPLTSGEWKNQLSKFFNVRVGKIQPGRKRYGNFIASSDNPTYQHPNHIFSEYEAADENTLGTIRIWDFTKADTRLQSAEGRAEIAGRERAVISHLSDRNDLFDSVILQPKSDDPERGVNYWEVYDRRRRLKRLKDFASSEIRYLTPDGKIELARQIIAKVSLLHQSDASHLDIGGHSVWLEAPSTAKLSHMMAAKLSLVESLGDRRYSFLSSVHLPEDMFGGVGEDAKRKDVFLVGNAVHLVLFGIEPKREREDLPIQWSQEVDAEGVFPNLYEWFETALALVPSDRFLDAAAALDSFNKATAARPTRREVIEGLESFRRQVRSQRQLFSLYPETTMVRESDHIDIWTSQANNQQLFIKMWKRAAWGDQEREGPRILDFLNRAQELCVSPPPGCAILKDVFWLEDAIAVVQDFVEGPNLADAILMERDSWQRKEKVLPFILRLTEVITALHERGVTHGDLKPQNIICGTVDSQPLLVDLIDFAASLDGEIMSTKYAPSVGGRIERDRYAVTKIAEELLENCILEQDSISKLNVAIQACQNSSPANGTLLPLIEALQFALMPPEEPASQSIELSIKGAELGPILPDEGVFFIRRLLDRRTFVLRGACEELEITLNDKGQPYQGRRKAVDQKRIGRLSKFENMSIKAQIAVKSSNFNEFSGLQNLLEDTEFQTLWSDSSASLTSDQVTDEEIPYEDSSSDVALDHQAESVSAEPVGVPEVNVKLLWRSLMDAEGDLTTDGIAFGDSTYDRDTKRHIVPFELNNGTFDFNRGDTVGVERLDRKGLWRRIGELDIGRSKPERLVIDASETGVNPRNSVLVDEDQRLRFTSHFEVQSFKRREGATSRILARQSRLPALADIFDTSQKMLPTSAAHRVREDDLTAYGLNDTQKAAFRSLVEIRPVGLVQGPPGTGKTVFIAALAHYALTHGLARNILLASQSHEAVNNAGEAVLKLFSREKSQPSILRVGNENVVSERLLPFHTDRVEQLYKDKLQAELRTRLRIAGKELGMPAVLVDELVVLDNSVRPVAERIAQLVEHGDPEEIRLRGLRATLANQLSRLGLISLAHQVELEDVDTIAILNESFKLVSERLPVAERVSPDKIAKLQTLAQLARDFISSSSTAQRSFEPFLAGTRQIVAGTCVGLGRPSLGLTTTHFDLVIVDEAARCTASELSVPMQAGRWIVLVGDHAQLEPQHATQIVSQVARQVGTTQREVLRSDFERLFSTPYGQQAGKSLTTQYRMLPPIGRVVSKTFYNGRLQHGRTTPEVDPSVLPTDLVYPITWLATDELGERSFQRRDLGATSLSNPAEAEVIVNLMKRWAGNNAFANWVAKQTKHSHVIGIICMYAAQRDLIRKRLHGAGLPDAFRKSIKIDTVDSYQGKENPIVVLSLVRNNMDGRQENGAATIADGFLSRPNRINVATSRAMDRLVIVGASNRWRSGTPMAELAGAIRVEVENKSARIAKPSELTALPEEVTEMPVEQASKLIGVK